MWGDELGNALGHCAQHRAATEFNAWSDRLTMLLTAMAMREQQQPYVGPHQIAAASCSCSKHQHLSGAAVVVVGISGITVPIKLHSCSFHCHQVLAQCGVMAGAPQRVAVAFTFEALDLYLSLWQESGILPKSYVEGLERFHLSGTSLTPRNSLLTRHVSAC